MWATHQGNYIFLQFLVEPLVKKTSLVFSSSFLSILNYKFRLAQKAL